MVHPKRAVAAMVIPVPGNHAEAPGDTSKLAARCQERCQASTSSTDLIIQRRAGRAIRGQEAAIGGDVIRYG
jgi:hypothetical protein